MADIFVDNAGSNTSPYDTWAKAATTLTTALAIATTADTVYVANTHSESTAGAVSLAFPSSPGLKVLCVTPSGASGNSGLATGAVVAVGAAANTLAITGFAYVYGILFQGGTNVSTSCDINIATSSTSHGLFFESCGIDLRSTSTSAQISLGFTGASGNRDNVVSFLNSSFKFGSTAGILLGHCRAIMRNISIDSAGATPTTLFTGQTGGVGNLWIEASDLSGESWSNFINAAWLAPGQVTIRDCKLPSGYALTTGTHAGLGGLVLKVHNCDSGDTTYNLGEVANAGTVVDETTLVRSGGGAQSHRMDSSADSVFPYHSLDVDGSIYNSAVGSAKTLTVEILHDSATNLKDNEIHVEVQHLGTSGFPQGVIDIDDRAADVLAAGTDQASSSVTWTTTGMSNPNKQKLVCTFTPQEAGYVHFKVRLSKPSKTVYADVLGATLS